MERNIVNKIATRNLKILGNIDIFLLNIADIPRKLVEIGEIKFFYKIADN